MKRYYYRPQLRNTSPTVFYVTLDELVDSIKPKVAKMTPLAHGHLTLVINREISRGSQLA